MLINDIIQLGESTDRNARENIPAEAEEEDE